MLQNQEIEVPSGKFCSFLCGLARCCRCSTTRTSIAIPPQPLPPPQPPQPVSTTTTATTDCHHRRRRRGNVRLYSCFTLLLTSSMYNIRVTTQLASTSGKASPPFVHGSLHRCWRRSQQAGISHDGKQLHQSVLEQTIEGLERGPASSKFPKSSRNSLY